MGLDAYPTIVRRVSVFMFTLLNSLPTEKAVYRLVLSE